jgi:predicted DNA-binding transcriptional regulator AlpA
MKGLPDRLWTLRETAEFLAIPVGTLYKLNHKGTGPRFFRVGKDCRYDPREVMAWLQTQVPATCC